MHGCAVRRTGDTNTEASPDARRDQAATDRPAATGTDVVALVHAGRSTAPAGDRRADPRARQRKRSGRTDAAKAKPADDALPRAVTDMVERSGGGASGRIEDLDDAVDWNEMKPDLGPASCPIRSPTGNPSPKTARVARSSTCSASCSPASRRFARSARTSRTTGSTSGRPSPTRRSASCHPPKARPSRHWCPPTDSPPMRTKDRYSGWRLVLGADGGLAQFPPGLMAGLIAPGLIERKEPLRTAAVQHKSLRRWLVFHRKIGRIASEGEEPRSTNLRNPAPWRNSRASQSAAALLRLACSRPPGAAETGFAGIHPWSKVGKKTCLVGHQHAGSGSGNSLKEAQSRAIGSWSSFTDLEYGDSWANYNARHREGHALRPERRQRLSMRPLGDAVPAVLSAVEQRQLSARR